MVLGKKFLDVEIPMLGMEVQTLGTPEGLHGKTINLDLSRKFRGRGVEAVFQIFNQDGRLITAPKKISLMKSYVQRMMRKRVNYVEDSFKVQCKDIRAVIKPLLITRKKVSRVVRKNLRNTTREFLVNYLKEKSYIVASDEILNNILQKELLPKLKKVYPLSFCDIRVFETSELDKIDLKEIFERVAKVEAVVEEVEEKTQAEEIEEAKAKLLEKKATMEEKVEKKVVKKSLSGEGVSDAGGDAFGSLSESENIIEDDSDSSLGVEGDVSSSGKKVAAKKSAAKKKVIKKDDAKKK